MYFIFVHGYNDRSAGRKNMDKAKPHLEALGHTVDTDSADYGWLGLFWVRFRKHAAVLRIVQAVQKALIAEEQVVLVGYSNGANYVIKALKLIFLGQVKVILVHPALRSKVRIPPAASKVWVAYTRSDWTVRLATYIRWLLPGWGRLGYTGYRGSDSRVESVDYTSVAKGHGGLWGDRVVEWFSGELDRMART